MLEAPLLNLNESLISTWALNRKDFNPSDKNQVIQNIRVLTEQALMLVPLKIDQAFKGVHYVDHIKKLYLVTFSREREEENTTGIAVYNCLT